MAEQTTIDPYGSTPPLILTMEEALDMGRENRERWLAALVGHRPGTSKSDWLGNAPEG